MKICPKYTFGVGDRFAHGAHAQLQAFIAAKELGIDITPVWNKSNREHDIIGSEPQTTRDAADAAVKDLGWSGEYLLEAQWVVGTDGYHSAVRDAIGDQFEGKDYPELWGVADSKIENWCHPRNLTCAQFQPPTVIPFPLGEDRWRIYFRPETADEIA